MTTTTAPDPLEAVEYAGWHLAAEPVEARMDELLNVVRKIMGLPVTGPVPELPGAPETQPESKHALALVRAPAVPEDAAGTLEDAVLGLRRAFEPESDVEIVKDDPGVMSAAVLVPAEVTVAVTRLDGVKMKFCRGCEREKPVTEFTKDGSKRGDGLRYRCRTCEATARREVREAKLRAQHAPTTPAA